MFMFHVRSLVLSRVGNKNSLKLMAIFMSPKILIIITAQMTIRYICIIV